MSLPPSAQNKILEMDKENLREIDGVVLDLDSYTRHTAAASAPPSPAFDPVLPAPSASAQSENAHPAAVFASPPVHVGWYETAQPEEPSYPMMAGAVMQTGVTAAIPLMLHTGSGSGSYLSSYVTSWMTSYRYGSGSWLTSGLYQSGMPGSGAYMPGGFGLELI